MKATIIVPSTSIAPPEMPVEGASVAEVFDSLGWSVYFLDVPAFNMTAEAVRVETEKEKPDLVAIMVNKWQYRYAKQYVGPIRKALPNTTIVAITDLNPSNLRGWLPEIDHAIKGPPNDPLRMLASRTKNRNFENVPSEVSPEGEANLPEYHPLTTNFEQHARLRAGRMIDIPAKLFGQQVSAENVVKTVVSLRLKYAIQGFNLLGDITDVTWLIPILKGFEEKELVGAPINLTWTCTIPDPMQLSTPIIRQLADHGCRVLIFEWRPGIKEQIDHILATAPAAGIQPMVRLIFNAQDILIFNYVEMTKLLEANPNLLVQPKFLEDSNQFGDEAYVASLSNGAYLPKSQNLHRDVQILAISNAVINRDTARLERLAKEK